MMVDNHLKTVTESPVGGDLSQQVLNSLTAEIAVVDQSGTIIAVNDTWRRFAGENGGTPAATGVGANYLDVCRLARGEDSLLAEQAFRGIEQVQNGSRDVFTLEYSCHSRSEKRWFLLHVSRLMGAEHFVVAAHHSITERKLTEQRLVEAERLAAIGEAMQGLSHEGRNALQRSQGCIELLRLQIAGDSDALDLLERIELAQEHLLGLYEEVRHYAAPIILRREPYSLSKLVDEVWASFAPKSKGVQFRNAAFGGNFTCYVDVITIHQVFKAIFENALAACLDSPVIEVSYDDDELDGLPAVTVVASDNGLGVPAGDRKKVFEPFYTTKTRGTGLGLAVASRIILAHGGRIFIGTPRLSGASVSITLPVNVRQKSAL